MTSPKNSTVSQPTLTELLAEMVELRGQLASHQAELESLKPRPVARSRLRRVGLNLSLVAIILLGVVGAFGTSPNQTQAQVGPNVGTGLSVTLPKFCAGCDRSSKTYPAYLNLSYAYLVGANYSNSTLTGAYTVFANLVGANLTGANLSHANLAGANLSYASLGGANLFIVILSDANLSYAQGTPFSTAAVTWSNTTCPDRTNTDTNGGTCVGHWLP